MKMQPLIVNMVILVALQLLCQLYTSFTGKH